MQNSARQDRRDRHLWLLAISMIVMLEGAFVLSRAMRSTEPLEIAGATAAAVVREALSTAKSL